MIAYRRGFDFLLFIAVFTIIYNDEFGDRKVAILDFDQKQYVLPIKAALSEVTELR